MRCTRLYCLGMRRRNTIQNHFAQGRGSRSKGGLGYRFGVRFYFKRRFFGPSRFLLKQRSLAGREDPSCFSHFRYLILACAMVVWSLDPPLAIGCTKGCLRVHLPSPSRAKVNFLIQPLPSSSVLTTHQTPLSKSGERYFPTPNDKQSTLRRYRHASTTAAKAFSVVKRSMAASHLVTVVPQSIQIQPHRCSRNLLSMRADFPHRKFRV